MENKLHSIANIFIANDHQIVINGIKAVLEKYPDVQIVGEAKSFPELIEALDGKKVNVLITDDVMNGVVVTDYLSQIKEKWPRIRIFILTLYPEYAKHLRECKPQVEAIINLADTKAHPYSTIKIFELKARLKLMQTPAQVKLLSSEVATSVAKMRDAMQLQNFGEASQIRCYYKEVKQLLFDRLWGFEIEVVNDHEIKLTKHAQIKDALLWED